jgi:endonuclease/exonuclease/phosphatase (EEP) superfamily protein YafD
VLAASAYLAALLAMTALVYGPGERLWPVTLFLFGPRWAAALPFFALLPITFVASRRLACVVAVAAAALAGPLFGLNLPWRALAQGPDPASPRIRLVTWNVGAGGAADGGLDDLFTVEAPDVVVLQEARAEVRGIPGWHRHDAAGMSVLSRFPILAAHPRDRGDVWRAAGSGAIVRYSLDTPLGRLDLTNVHLETPREGLESLMSFGPGAAEDLVAKNEQRRLEARLARDWALASPSGLQLVAGDFNTPVESDIYREHWHDFGNCHSDAGWGFGFTKRTRLLRTRIDHVLVGPGLACLSARVGRSRGDHSPLVVEIGFAGR